MLSGTHRGPTAHDYAIHHRPRYFFLFSQLAPRLTVMFGFLALLGLYSYRGMLGRNSLTTAQQTRRERAESLQGRTRSLQRREEPSSRWGPRVGDPWTGEMGRERRFRSSLAFFFFFVSFLFHFVPILDSIQKNYFKHKCINQKYDITFFLF